VATRRPTAGKRSSSSSQPRRASANAESHREAVVRVVDALRRIVRALHRSNRLAEQRWQVSAAQLLVLQRLAEAPSLSVNELADRTFTHQSTVSVVVTRLVKRGLVARTRADDDARRAELTLTTPGRALLRRAMGAAQTQLMDALDRMSSRQLQDIDTCMEQIVEALGVADEPAGMFFEDVSAGGTSNGRGNGTRTRSRSARPR
jgi:MarR family transcriptional regulator, lower aerobic nicotinate degradation pathway regulator